MRIASERLRRHATAAGWHTPFPAPACEGKTRQNFNILQLPLPAKKKAPPGLEGPKAHHMQSQYRFVSPLMRHITVIGTCSPDISAIAINYRDLPHQPFALATTVPFGPEATECQLLSKVMITDQARAFRCHRNMKTFIINGVTPAFITRYRHGRLLSSADGFVDFEATYYLMVHNVTKNASKPSAWSSWMFSTANRLFSR